MSNQIKGLMVLVDLLRTHSGVEAFSVVVTEEGMSGFGLGEGVCVCV